jgi:hypothetical protein
MTGASAGGQWWEEALDAWEVAEKTASGVWKRANQDLDEKDNKAHGSSSGRRRSSGRPPRPPRPPGAAASPNAPELRQRRGNDAAPSPRTRPVASSTGTPYEASPQSPHGASAAAAPVTGMRTVAAPTRAALHRRRRQQRREQEEEQRRQRMQTRRPLKSTASVASGSKSNGTGEAATQIVEEDCATNRRAAACQAVRRAGGIIARHSGATEIGPVASGATGFNAPGRNTCKKAAAITTPSSSGDSGASSRAEHVLAQRLAECCERAGCDTSPGTVAVWAQTAFDAAYPPPFPGDAHMIHTCVV